MDINEWLSTLTGGATARDIAKKAGISERTLQHQTHTGKLSVENAVKISAAYGRHPLRTLIDFGVVDAAWAQVPDVEAALRLARDHQLTDEILNRLDLVDYDPIYDVPVDELAAKRKSNTSTPDVQDPEDDSMPADAVANDRPEEGGTPDDFEP